ncbi:MAG: CPBP family intramembrane metalloprotease [Chitinophagaceae bacterium]|nr:MAG: CPBP family intramembrane metalloprotease [Chitinophagaceae bacterium]
MFYSMQSWMSAFIARLSRINTAVLFIGGLLLQAAIMVTFALLWWAPATVMTNSFTGWKQFLIVVIAAPFIETLIFQYAILTSMLNTVRSTAIAIFVSALAFSLTHFYSAQYLVATFCSGVLFAVLYLVFQHKNNRGFLYVLLIHSIYNFFVFAMKHWFN